MKKETLLILIALAAVFGITLYTANQNQKPEDELLSGGGDSGGGWAAYGDSAAWTDLITRVLQPSAAEQTAFQAAAEPTNSGRQWFYADDFAKLTGFATADDPLLKAGILETQLKAGWADGTYQVSAPYAPTAAGAQLQIKNTLNQSAPSTTTNSRSNSGSGGGGFGSAKVVDTVSGAVNSFRDTVSNLTKPKPNPVGQGFGGGFGGAR